MLIHLLYLLLCVAASAQTPVERPSDAWSLTYDRGLALKGDDVRIEVAGRVQARWTYQDLQSAWGVKRARLSSKVDLGPLVAVRFQGAGETGRFEVKDLYGVLRFAPGWLELTAGQLKEPFSRQQIASSGKMQFLERALTDGAFDAGRGIGAELGGGGGHTAGVTWRAGVYVRPDPSQARQVPRGLLRVDFDPDGAGFEEVDLDGGPLRVAVGAALRAPLMPSAEPWAAQVDAQLKVAGLSATSAVYTAQDGALGGHLQVGYCFEGRVQGSLRGSWVQGEVSGNEQLAGVTVFVDGYRLYLQLDGGRVQQGEAAGWSARSQVQLIL